MPPPKDPIKYAEYIRKQRESHLGKVPPNKGVAMPQEQKDLLREITLKRFAEETPEQRDQRIERFKQSQSTTQAKENMSQGRRRYFIETPGALERASKATSKYFAETPGAIDRNRETQRRRYEENPELRDRHSKIQTETHARPETRDKMSAGQRKYYEEHPEAIITQSLRRIGTKAAPSTKTKMSEGKRGEDNPNFKHGLTGVYRNTRYSAKNNEFRGEVFQRDNFIDQITLQPLKHDERIVHHRVGYNDILRRHKIKTFDQAMKCNALWNPDNGVTMNKEIHEQFHVIYGNHCPTITESKRREKQFARRLDRMLW